VGKAQPRGEARAWTMRRTVQEDGLNVLRWLRVEGAACCRVGSDLEGNVVE
jgi:hypothetical protein